MSAPAAAAAVPAWDDQTNYSDPETLPWTEFPRGTWVDLFDNNAIAPYRAAAIAVADRFANQYEDREYRLAASSASAYYHPGFSEDWNERWEYAYATHLHRALFAQQPPLYPNKMVTVAHSNWWSSIETRLTLLLLEPPEDLNASLYSVLYGCLRMSSAMRDNLLRVSFDRLTTAQINEFGQWLRAQVGDAWTPPTDQPTWHHSDSARVLDRKGLMWLKLRAYVKDYLWRARVGQAALTRHLASRHHVPQAVLDHVLAPMLDERRTRNTPAPVELRPPAHLFPPPRTSYKHHPKSQ